MAKQGIDIGIEGNDGTGDSIRESFRKVNENFQELYAVFGLGGRISLTNLDDTPDDYTGLAGHALIVSQDELRVDALQFASNSALTGDEADDTITFNFTQSGKVILQAIKTGLSSDDAPTLNSAMNANGFAIGGVAVTQAAADSLVNKYGGDFSINDLVIDKGYADKHYVKGGIPGKQGGVRPEPVDASEYTLTIGTFNLAGDIVITGHGLDRSSNGAPYTYNSTVTPATGLTSGSTYYVSIISPNVIRLHPTANDAINATNQIALTGGAGVQTLVDQGYEAELAGFYLANEAMPRNAVVRRQGDSMTGILNLSDHPGGLAGQGTPTGSDDLQAATKYYVDQSTYFSQTNFFVSTSGDDNQTATPAGQDGRSLGYAYRTIGAAARKAEELMLASRYELGPYKQTITYGSTATRSIIASSGTQTVTAWANDASLLIDNNIEFIKAQVIGYINTVYPNFDYNSETCARDIGYIVNSVKLDTISGANANYLSRWAGMRYYANVSAAKAITTQLTETVGAITYAKLLVDSIIKGTTVTTYQDLYTQDYAGGAIVSATGIASIAAKFQIVLDIIDDGVFNTPNIVDGSVYELNITNGGNGFVDQGNPTNTDILPGKSVRGLRSGALGRIVRYFSEDDPLSVTPTGQDTLELQLLEPTLFIDGEELEYANTVKLAQITIHIESGQYEEDLPIRVTQNVSIKGDEFRRVIVRPKNRASQSPWANTYFYRDKKFDNLAGDSSSITGFADTNLPTSGGNYVDPLTGNVVGYFGRHYLTDNTKNVNVGNFALTNPGGFNNAATHLSRNKNFIVEEVIQFITATYPSLVYIEAKCRRDTGYIIDGIISDIKTGGRDETLKNQGEYYIGAVTGQETETVAAINYIKTISAAVISNTEFAALGGIDQIIDTTIVAEATAQTNIDALVNCINYAFNVNFNPARNNRELDVFLMDDATIIRNISVQGHGGFMMVLDPSGQVLTKSPYCQTGSSFSQSINRQAFRGGMFVDAYTGNTPMEVIGKTNNYEISVRSTPETGLFIKKPAVPAPFYIDGQRFQVNAVRDWDQVLGTAVLILDKSSNNTNGWTGILADSFNLDTVAPGSPIEITTQTAGNRSMLGNDFTQMNDLGYGLVVTNGGLSEMVSQFTYYCWTSYYASNGGQIRSLNGSNAYGQYGLVAEGSDPNEIPDNITLRDNMVKPGLTALAGVILDFADVIGMTATAGDTVTQAVTGATGTVVFTTTGKRLYLKATSGSFNNTNDITVVATNIGAPETASAPGYALDIDQLSLYAYDFESLPQNRGELDIIHTGGTIARYEVTSVTKIIDFIVDAHLDVDYTPGVGVTGTLAVFDITKTRQNSGEYGVVIKSGGSSYSVSDTFTVLGSKIDGVDVTNDAVITVTEVNGLGIITAATVAGTPVILADTPTHSGQVYQLRFATNNSGYSNDGLITALEQKVPLNYRQNQVFVLEGIANTERLTIRPSTAMQFDEKPGETYRTITFNVTESTGEALGPNTILSSIDSTYDYVRVIVDSDAAALSTHAGAGTTMGATAGDVVIAIELIEDVGGGSVDIARINSGNMIISWSGKIHTIDNYVDRGTYATIEITDVAGSDINTSANVTGLHSTIVLANQITTLRAGLPSGDPGTITIQISTCRATGHDFLDIGSGGFNTSNYPNVLLGDPQEPRQENEVQERDKGRVFYVSTDQDGFFRVGRFFTVDQGTGTVTFAGSIALSNLDGIGFKRGVVVAEFSTDDAMTQNGTDIVPVQSAVRGYVNRRLGWDHNGLPVGNIIGAGAVPRDGTIAMTGNLSMGSNQIINLQAPSADSHAATKAYVDGVVDNYDSVEELRNVEINSIAKDQLLFYTGKKRIIVDGDTVGGTGIFADGQSFTQAGGGNGTIVDVETTTDPILGNILKITYTATSGTVNLAAKIIVAAGPTGDVLDGPFDELGNGIRDAGSQLEFIVTRTQGATSVEYMITDDSIVNADVNSNAAIAQSKLAMNAATGRATASGITQDDLGLASFDSGDFSVTDGWVSLNGIDLADIESIGSFKVLGNISGVGASPTQVDITSQAANNSLVLTRSNGEIVAKKLIIGADTSYVVLQPKSDSATTIEMLTPGGATILTATGTTAAKITTNIGGNLDIGGSGAATQSSLQQGSPLNDSSRLSASWVYTDFVGPTNDKTAQAPGVAIGSASGKSSAGAVSIVTKNGVASVVPAKFTGTGFLADTDNTYDIGTNLVKYRSLYVSGIGNSITVTGNIVPEADNTRNIGSSGARYNTVYANTFTGIATQAKYADLAENYVADLEYEPGTVLVFGGSNEVTVTDKHSNTRVAGVVSTNPAHLMNSEAQGDYIVPVALQGRVPCKVIGKVQPGDMLVTSGIAGYAIVNNSPQVGTIIGKAVGHKLDDVRGIVEVVVGRV